MENFFDDILKVMMAPREFFTLAVISQKMCAKHYPEHLFFRWIELRICSDLAHFLGEWSQIENLSEINPPL